MKTVWYPVFTSDDATIYPGIESVKQTVEMRSCAMENGTRVSVTDQLCAEMYLGSYAVTVLSTNKENAL